VNYSIYRKLGIETTANWYSHMPKWVTEHEDITVLQMSGHKRIENFCQAG
jgi:hypothetical protein